MSTVDTQEESLSARRAWIEIGESNRNSARRDTVALRKESVDRNARIGQAVVNALGRSPQGERG